MTSPHDYHLLIIERDQRHQEEVEQVKLTVKNQNAMYHMMGNHKPPKIQALEAYLKGGEKKCLSTDARSNVANLNDCSAVRLDTNPLIGGHNRKEEV